MGKKGEMNLTDVLKQKLPKNLKTFCFNGREYAEPSKNSPYSGVDTKWYHFIGMLHILIRICGISKRGMLEFDKYTGGYRKGSKIGDDISPFTFNEGKLLAHNSRLSLVIEPYTTEWHSDAFYGSRITFFQRDGDKILTVECKDFGLWLESTYFIDDVRALLEDAYDANEDFGTYRAYVYCCDYCGMKKVDV